jgi:hypothetical protein
MNIEMFVFLMLCVVLIRLIKIAFTKKRKPFEDEAAEFATHLILTYVFYTVFHFIIW